VKGIGQSTTKELWQRGWLNTPAGLYSVTKDDLLQLPLFGSRKADKALAAIEASRSMDLATLLCGLGIE
jgi:DNA ligase (NAD+)